MVFDLKSHRRRNMNEQIDNSSPLSLSQVLELIKTREGENFSKEKVNLAELQRLTGITRGKLRRLKKNRFEEKPNGNKGRTSAENVLSGYESVLNNFLKTNITNSQVCFERLQELGYEGGLTSVKVYIQKHKNLVPAPRQMISEPTEKPNTFFSKDKNQIEKFAFV